MNDDDDAPSSSDRSPSTSPPPAQISVVYPSISLLPPTNAHFSDSVTVATPAPRHQTLTLALPIQPPPGSSGGGREDCWSEGATSALIDAWGEHFLALSRGNLKQKHWQEVAEVVSSRDDYTKPLRSDVQCKNRIDTLKRKYKIEKPNISAVAAAGLSVSSSWPFFDRLDILLGPIMKTPPSAAPAKQPSPAAVATAARSQFPQKQRTSMPMKRKASSLLLPPAPASSTSDSLPPVTPVTAPSNGRRKRAVIVGMKVLTQAILKFGEVYQRVESLKLQQTMEMEKQRLGFARELEMQRMQFFMTSQMELSQIRRHLPPSGVGGGGSGGGSSNNYLHHSRRGHQQSAGNGNNNVING
ncbi:hypothetical protein M5K25_018565 [Dendrobium thyrsiflorum]|uniref:Myb/SANT-like DNA-binding domain-containing protein n=1 Tax=Dendrobium thyrsiflorum TaxID=117978 RepID=A0ABD0UQV1_DENTH